MAEEIGRLQGSGPSCTGRWRFRARPTTSARSSPRPAHRAPSRSSSRRACPSPPDLGGPRPRRRRRAERDPERAIREMTAVGGPLLDDVDRGAAQWPLLQLRCARRWRHAAWTRPGAGRAAPRRSRRCPRAVAGGGRRGGGHARRGRRDRRAGRGGPRRGAGGRGPRAARAAGRAGARGPRARRGRAPRRGRGPARRGRAGGGAPGRHRLRDEAAAAPAARGSPPATAGGEADRSALTPREADVARLVARGGSNREVAAALLSARRRWRTTSRGSTQARRPLARRARGARGRHHG